MQTLADQHNRGNSKREGLSAARTSIRARIFSGDAASAVKD